MYGDFTFANNVVFTIAIERLTEATIGVSSILSITTSNLVLQTAFAHRLLKPESERSKVVFDNFGKAYVAGNFVEGYLEVSEDNWKGEGLDPPREPRLTRCFPRFAPMNLSPMRK